MTITEDIDLCIVKANFESISYYKRQNNSIEQIMETLFADRNDKKVFDLYKIAFENSDDEKQAIEKMEEYIELMNKNKTSNPCIKVNTKDAVVLDEVVLQLCFLTDLAYDKFNESREISNNYKELIEYLVLQRTYFVVTNGKVKVYDLVPIENRKDEFGSWKYDPFAGHLKLFAKMPNNDFFPKIWKLDEQSKMKFVTIERLPNDIQQTFHLNMPLEAFLELAIGDADTIKVFHNLHINTVEDLKNLGDEGWRVLESRIPAACLPLKNAVDKIGGTKSEKETSQRTKAEELSDWHKLKLFLYYANKSDEYKDFGFLDETALELGFAEQQSDKSFDIGMTMNQMKEALKVYTIPQKNNVMREKSYGMLFYGPAGTGKTRLSTIIIKKAGLAQIVEPLSSAELNRSLVGATEKLLMDIFQRATYCPHLLCCVAIDEVDALTPKRNDKAAGHKVDALSLLLSLIGGIKHIPNVFVIASTNRLNKIDEAFSRRLQDKFYIGRLTNKQRIDLLSQISSKRAGLPEHVKIDFNSRKLTSLIAKLTTNFSGAALAALRSRLLIYFDLHRNNKNVNTLTDDLLISTAIKVANDFQIKLGRYSIPKLIQDSLSKELLNIWDEVKRNVKTLSGRILIEMQEDSTLIGFEIMNKNELLEMEPRNKFSYVSELIPIILDFCVQFEIDNIQLIDCDTLLSASAFDDNAINDLVNEALEEFERYEHGLIVFDVDTLVGVNESLSDGLENESKSYSTQNQRLWQNILHACKRSYYSNGDLNKRKWVIVISGSHFLIDQFKNIAKFPLSSVEKNKRIEDENRRTKERKCINCDSFYYEYQNRIDACMYHDGALVNLNSKEHPTSKEIIIDIARGQDKKTLEEIQEIFKPYFYLCCMRPFTESKDMGCKRNFHSDEHKYIFDTAGYY